MTKTDESEEDRVKMDEHSCGKCGNLFSSIEDFIEHKRVSCTSTPKSPPSVIHEELSSNPRKNGHVCEICGFQPKSGTKSRERLEHMARKHFKARIDRELSQSSGVNTCPLCEYVGKCKQELIRHYTRRHKVLERYMAEDKLENGIYEKNEAHKYVSRKTPESHPSYITMVIEAITALRDKTKWGHNSVHAEKVIVRRR